MTTPLYHSRPSGFDIQPAAQEKATQINDFIWLSEGLSNSYLLLTEKGRIIVNTGMGFEAPIHKRNFDAISNSPISYIILTQGHVDHLGGVDYFRETETEVVAHTNNPTHQADDARIARFRTTRSSFAFADAISNAAKHAKKVAAESGDAANLGQSRPEATILFEKECSIELGGLQLELISTPGGETTDSLVIWLPQHKICFTGNLFGALFGHFPNLVTLRGDRYRDPLRFIDSLDRVRKLHPKQLLVGHHQPVNGSALIQNELTRLRAAVQYVHDATVAGMNEGKDINRLMREIQLPTSLEVGEGYGKVSWCVRAIWENYAGWFHHESTCELYPKPEKSIDHELLDVAGGAAGLAIRANQRFQNSDPIGAIQLCEIVLRVDPHCAEALQVSIDAHSMLLKQSNNFWESAWLQKTLTELRTRIGTGDA